MAANNIPTKENFRRAYEGEAPWEIGRPQQAFLDVEDQIAGAVLDLGCGSGELAIYLAERGRSVTGLDYLETPIERARAEAKRRGVQATFEVADATRLAGRGEAFDSAVDSGLFHGLSDEDRGRYVSGLAQLLKPSARFFLLCFSDQEPPGQGPRRVAEEEIRAAFEDGWRVESISLTRFEVRPNLQHFKFSPGGPHAWFCSLQRDTNG